VCKAGYAVLVAHDAGSGEYEDKQIRRCRALIAGFASARPSLSRVGVPPSGLQLGERTRGCWSEGSMRGYGKGDTRKSVCVASHALVFI